MISDMVKDVKFGHDQSDWVPIECLSSRTMTDQFHRVLTPVEKNVKRVMKRNGTKTVKGFSAMHTQ